MPTFSTAGVGSNRRWQQLGSPETSALVALMHLHAARQIGSGGLLLSKEQAVALEAHRAHER